MDAFEITALFMIPIAIAIGIGCCVSIRRKHYLWPIVALFAVPAIMLVIEANAFPSNLDGVTSLTGIFTMMFSVIWVPYWIIMALLGVWFAPKSPPEL